MFWHSRESHVQQNVLFSLAMPLKHSVCYRFFPLTAFFVSFHLQKTGGRDQNCSYLISSEESTEKCVLVIENSIPPEINQINCKDYGQSEQSYRDSGNYSNDDDICGNKKSHDTKEEAAV